MKNLGSLLLLLGIGSSALYIFDYNLSYLMWIDNWGDTVGWAIRGGMTLLGAVLFVLGSSGTQDEETAEAE